MPISTYSGRLRIGKSNPLDLPLERRRVLTEIRRLENLAWRLPFKIPDAEIRAALAERSQPLAGRLAARFALLGAQRLERTYGVAWRVERPRLLLGFTAAAACSI